MKELKFRNLRADEIECRVGTQAKDLSWVTLLLYKDARVDMRLLDEVVGATNWKREHQLIDGQLFCTVSIWDEDKKEWVGKQDVGIESNTEEVKGRASDSFKRACFNLGIGRELYTAPFIFVQAQEGDVKNNRFVMTFSVQSIGYDNDGNVNALVIVDKKGNIRYKMGTVQSVPTPNSLSPEQTLKKICAQAALCNSMQELTDLRNSNMAYKDNETFRNALNNRASQLKQNVA